MFSKIIETKDRVLAQLELNKRPLLVPYRHRKYNYHVLELSKY
jgi:hypothetical protein